MRNQGNKRSNQNQSPPKYKFYMPQNTKKVLCNEKFYGKSDNLYLLLSRYMCKKIVTNKSGDETGQNKPLGILFSKSHNAMSNFPKDILGNCNRKLEILIARFPHHVSFQFRAEKIAIGIGIESPLSSLALMSLHPLYGVPYLPASGIKGVIRNAWIQEKADGSEEKALMDEQFRKLFGAGGNSELGQKGDLVFFDAFPEVNSSKVVYDVITPHYKDYYNNEGKNPPTDDQNPNPLQFPIIKDGSFKIVIGQISQEKNELKEIETIIKLAFERFGVGAKTSIGYGLGKVHAIDYK